MYDIAAKSFHVIEGVIRIQLLFIVKETPWNLQIYCYKNNLIVSLENILLHN